MGNKKKSITQLARDLRNNPTPAERKLWRYLRNRQMDGYRFLRQKPIIYKQQNNRKLFFITDFYCSEQKLAIELDGEYHQLKKSYDRNRDLVIQKLGICVLHIENSELENMENVINRIKDYLR